MVAESPSPMPPPRSRPRGDDSVTVVVVEGGGVNGGGADGDVKAAGALAEGIIGVVVLLASEWVEVGSGLAEVSLRADTWGHRLLSLLLQVKGRGGGGGGGSRFCVS